MREPMNRLLGSKNAASQNITWSHIPTYLAIWHSLEPAPTFPSYKR